MNAFFSSPFRPFFLLSTLYSVLALAVWIANVIGYISQPHVTLVWHIREMMFGFVGSVMLGFLLTAGATWTGQATLKGMHLAFVVLIWVLTRCLWLSESVPFVAAAFDATVFALGALQLARMVNTSRNRRNYAFPFVLLVFSVLCAYESYTYLVGSAVSLLLLQSMFFVMMHIVLVMGGRVIPFFTDRGLQRAQTKRYQLLELASLMFSVCFIFAYLMQLPLVICQLLSALVGLSNILRWMTWRPKDSVKNMMLWPLHVSYLLVCLGFLAYAVNMPSNFVMHVFAIGGFGVMILSMVSRVSLGHIGRQLVLPRFVSVAFYLMLISLLSRIAAVYFTNTYHLSILISATAWAIAYGLFIVKFAGILLGPRADSR